MARPKKLVPNRISVSDSDLHCYVCDRTLPRAMFIVNSNEEVCLECRNTLAYQKMYARLHFMKACSYHDRYESITAFAGGDKVASRCRHANVEYRREKRAEGRSMDGYRHRWYREFRHQLAVYGRCMMCGDQHGQYQLVHLDPSSKFFHIGQSVSEYDIPTVKHEIQKCDPYCDECAELFVNSRLYKEGRSRKKVNMDWDRIFDDVDRIVQKRTTEGKDVQLTLFKLN